jgi:hypothetical protein
MTTQASHGGVSPSGLEIAAQWAALPPEHLRVALARLEPELKRQHEARMKTLALEEQAQMKSTALDEVQAKRDFVLRLTGLCVG